jgi:hypothetical protein
MSILTLQIELTLIDELLGTASANPDIYREFIESKRPSGDAGESETLPPVEDELAKSTTVFHRTADGRPFLYDYAIKGFFKDACGCLRRADDGASKGLKAYKKEIDGLIFVEPRQIVLNLPQGQSIGICQRPLRAQTAQGERVSLARSETVPAGTTLTFTLSLMRTELEGAVAEWLSYGRFRGLGQWRNSGKGKFTWRNV